MTVLTKPIQTRNVIGLSLTSNTKDFMEQGGFAKRRGFDSRHLHHHAIYPLIAVVSSLDKPHLYQNNCTITNLLMGHVDGKKLSL